MALTKADMAESLFNELGLNKREARELVDILFEDLRAALVSGEQVKLSGFGNFDLRDKNGVADAPIVFKALGDSALINIAGPLRDDGINIENADFIVIDGFISNDMTGNGNGIRFVLADNCVVRNCRCDGPPSMPRTVVTPFAANKIKTRPSSGDAAFGMCACISASPGSR